MDKIKCEVIRDLMPLVADEVASEESKELVNEHMEDCEVCKAYYAGMTAQMLRNSMPEDGPTGAFVKFTKQMKKRVRMKKVMVALTAAFVALCVVIVGACVVYDRMNTSVHMDIDKTQAWLWRESNGEVNLAIRMKEGYGWYYKLGSFREGDVFYLVPYEPELKLWNKGVHGGLNKENQLELLWEDGKLYYHIDVSHTVYNVETGWFEDNTQEYKIPIRYVRWGTDNNYTTLYEEGDTIPTREEIYEIIYPSAEEDASAPEATDLPKATTAPTVTVVPAAKED